MAEEYKGLIEVDGWLLQKLQLDKLREMWENGCPTYDPAKYEDSGLKACWFCNSIETYWSGSPSWAEINHLEGCPWLTLEELFGET